MVGELVGLLCGFICFFPVPSPGPYSLSPAGTIGIFDPLRGIELKLLVRRPVLHLVGHSRRRSLKRARRRIRSISTDPAEVPTAILLSGAHLASGYLREHVL